MGLTKTQLWFQYVQSFLCCAGIVVSAYALFIEFEKEHNPDYRPFCDFNGDISCTKAFMSKYGKGFGLVGPIFGENHVLNMKNPIYGIFFYMVLLVLGMSHSVFFSSVYVGLAVVSNVGSVYLAYVLYFKIKSLCIVCATMYLINALILVAAWKRRVVLRKLTKKQR